MDEVMSESKWEKQEKALAAEVQKIAKESKSKILTGIAKEKKMQYDEESKQKCELVRMVMREAMDMYQDGEMTFDEMKADIKTALDAIK